MEQTNEYENRLKTLDYIRENGIKPYVGKYVRSHTLAEAFDLPEGSQVTVAGRVMSMRDMGKIAFIHLQD